MLPEMLVRLKLRSPRRGLHDTYEEMFAPSGLRVFRQALEDARRREQFYLSLAHLLDALAERGEHADAGDHHHRPAVCVQFRAHPALSFPSGRYAVVTSAVASPRQCPQPVTITWRSGSSIGVSADSKGGNRPPRLTASAASATDAGKAGSSA